MFSLSVCTQAIGTLSDMFFNHPYVDLSGPGLLPDPPDMHRSSQFGFNEQHDFRRGDESVSVDHFNQFDPDCGGLFHGSTGGPGLPSTNIVDYDHMRAGTFEYGHEQEIGQPHIGHTPDVGYYAHDQVPLEMEELGQGEFGRFREDAGRAHDIRQCSVSDRERDRDRLVFSLAALFSVMSAISVLHPCRDVPFRAYCCHLCVWMHDVNFTSLRVCPL